MPDPAAGNNTEHAAVALHAAAGSEITPPSRHVAANGAIQISFADSSAAARIHRICASDIHQSSSVQDAAHEIVYADGTVRQHTSAGSTVVDVQQPNFAHRSAADELLTSLASKTLASDSEASAADQESSPNELRLSHPTANHQTAPVKPSLSHLAVSASANRVGMVPSVLAKKSALAQLVRAMLMPVQQSQPIRDKSKGKGRASAADLQRMAAQAGKTVGSTLKQAKLAKSEMRQLRAAHQEADFVRKVEASKRAGAGPSTVESSFVVKMLHTAAEVAYYIAGAVKGSCEGLLRAFWRV